MNFKDPLGLFAPIAIRGRTPEQNKDSIVPDYGNWGGPDYSGGLRPSQNNGQNGTGAPIDAQDALYQTHDLAYGQYGITPRTPNSNCDEIKCPVDRQKCEAKRKADAALYLGLRNLPDNDSWLSYGHWYRVGALHFFPWPN